MPIYTYTTLDDPLATRVGTIAQGINATGQIVGYYTASVNLHGLLFSGGTYTTLNDPLATGLTVASGINDMGQIVGFYDNDSGRHGFLYSGGTYTTIDDPLGASDTRAFGINAAGQIVGQYTDASDPLRLHGFLLTITPKTPPPAGTPADTTFPGPNPSPPRMA